MANTPTHGIYYPTGSDPLTPLENVFSSVASSVETALNDLQPPAAANFAGLPTTGNVLGDERYTTDTKIFWKWDGARWVPTGGRLPWAHMYQTASQPINTTAVVVPFGGGTSSGIFSGSTLTIPAGLGGTYNISVSGRMNTPASNGIGALYLNDVEIAGTSMTTGSQEWFTMSHVLDLPAAGAVTFRFRIFAAVEGAAVSSGHFNVSYNGAS